MIGGLTLCQRSCIFRALDSQPNWRAIETAAVCEEIRTFGSVSEQFGKYPCNLLALCLLIYVSDTLVNVWSTSGICGKLLD